MVGGSSSSLDLPKQCHRSIELLELSRKEKHQARVLTVKEVNLLVDVLIDEKEALADRIAAGCFLFCLHSRSRWSDIRKVYGFQEDISEEGGRLSGYLECKTRAHKTARTVARQGLAMPLVAPIWGTGKTPWGIHFTRVYRLIGKNLDELANQPMLPAPSLNGDWMDRAVTSKEAGEWLMSIIHRREPSCERTTIHTLKGTPLSWCGKYGLQPESRLLFGHHASGKHSADTYARNVLAQPLREYETVLQQIRTGAFKPDNTRSGLLSQDVVADPKALPGERADETNSPIEAGSSSSSSSSSSDSDSSHEAHVEEQEAAAHDSIVQSSQWEPDVKMYQHDRSSIVHVMAMGTTNTASVAGTS